MQVEEAIDVIPIAAISCRGAAPGVYIAAKADPFAFVARRNTDQRIYFCASAGEPAATSAFVPVERKLGHEGVAGHGGLEVHRSRPDQSCARRQTGDVQGSGVGPVAVRQPDYEHAVSIAERTIAECPVAACSADADADVLELHPVGTLQLTA